MMMLDLDDFKKYNDRFGHQQGDEAIKIQARIMSRSLSETDILVGMVGKSLLLY